MSNLDTREEFNEQETEKEEASPRDYKIPGSGRTKGSRKGEGRIMRNRSKNIEDDKPDIVVESITQIILSDLGVPAVAVFEHPDDYPTSYVGRVLSIKSDYGLRETEAVIVKDNLLDLHRDIAENNDHHMSWAVRTSEKIRSLRGIWI